MKVSIIIITFNFKDTVKDFCSQFSWSTH